MTSSLTNTIVAASENSRPRYAPVLLDRHPLTDHPDRPLPDAVPHFCFPSGVCLLEDMEVGHLLDQCKIFIRLWITSFIPFFFSSGGSNSCLLFLHMF